VTRHSHRLAVDEPDTYEELIQFWQRLDEPQELRHPRTPHAIVIARWVVALYIVTVLAWLPTMLRAVAGALE
jgi:hypothetical protein